MTQGRAEKELQNKGKGFYFGENFTSKLHNIPGDAKSMIPKLSLLDLMVFCSGVYVCASQINASFLLVLLFPREEKAYI